MHLVLAYIDQHLDQSLDLAALARVASFSAFHFHRLFGAWAGERVGDYLRRRRLELGAVRLSTQPDTTVLAVALTVGFSSAEAFSRAFKEHFGAAPSAWREAAVRNPDQVLRKLGHARCIRATEYGHRPITGVSAAMAAMKVSVIERTPRRVTYLRRTGAYGEGTPWSNSRIRPRRWRRCGMRCCATGCPAADIP